MKEIKFQKNESDDLLLFCGIPNIVRKIIILFGLDKYFLSAKCYGIIEILSELKRDKIIDNLFDSYKNYPRIIIPKNTNSKHSPYLLSAEDDDNGN